MDFNLLLGITALWLWQGSERAASVGEVKLDCALTVLSHAVYLWLVLRVLG